MSQTDIEQHALIVSAVIGTEILSIRELKGGRNSKVYKVESDENRCYAAKFYFEPAGQKRNRLQIEFSTLQFLWNKGLRCIPKPIASDTKRNCAVYQFIDGKKISSSELLANDIDAATDFLIRLKELSRDPESSALPAASAACFSTLDIVNILERRLKKLGSLPAESEEHQKLRAFLEEKFAPSFKAILQQCTENMTKADIHFSELPMDERTLSPSDFGFHNALRKSDGQIVFLDFEYFGWDDPAKMISDFLLHPGMSLPEQLQARFLQNLLPTFNQGNFTKRLKTIYPLFGLIWCLLILNEFIPDNLRRRTFADKDLDNRDLLAKQLQKAEQLLHKINKGDISSKFR